MKTLLIALLMLVLACPALAEEAAPAATSTLPPTADSIVEGGYTAPATPVPVPTEAPPPLREDPLLQHVVEIACRIDLLAKNERFMNRFDFSDLSDEAVAALTHGDHSRPQGAYHLRGDALFAALYAGMDPADRLDMTRAELRRDLVNELPEILCEMTQKLIQFPAIVLR